MSTTNKDKTLANFGNQEMKTLKITTNDDKHKIAILILHPHQYIPLQVITNYYHSRDRIHHPKCKYSSLELYFNMDGCGAIKGISLHSTLNFLQNLFIGCPILKK